MRIGKMRFQFFQILGIWIHLLIVLARGDDDSIGREDAEKQERMPTRYYLDRIKLFFLHPSSNQGDPSSALKFFPQNHLKLSDDEKGHLRSFGITFEKQKRIKLFLRMNGRGVPHAEHHSPHHKHGGAVQTTPTVPISTSSTSLTKEAQLKANEFSKSSVTHSPSVGATHTQNGSSNFLPSLVEIENLTDLDEIQMLLKDTVHRERAVHEELERAMLDSENIEDCLDIVENIP